jgi:hypothetical protein
MTDYERSLYDTEIEKLMAEVAKLQAQIAELTAQLLDQESD